MPSAVRSNETRNPTMRRPAFLSAAFFFEASTGANGSDGSLGAEAPPSNTVLYFGLSPPTGGVAGETGGAGGLGLAEPGRGANGSMGSEAISVLCLGAGPPSISVLRLPAGALP